MLFKPDNDKQETDAAAAPQTRSVAGRARRRIVGLTVTAVILGGLGYIGWSAMQQPQTRPGGFGGPGGPGGRGGGGLAVPVLAATPRIEDVPVYLDGVGSVRALNTVTVRAQVDGRLLAVNFKEGQDVKAGDLLAEIDPVIYQAQYDQAVAKKAQDEAQLANARLDLTRYEQLAAAKAGSTQQADTQRALVAQLQAQVKSDQAAIDNAKATLGYTKVTAPLSGRTGLRQVDAGNIVHASDSTGIVVITQMEPIAVWFSLPQQQVVRVNTAAAAGPLGVEVFGTDGRTVVDSGTLLSIDNQVDATTGTVKLKAELPNGRRQLWPGQFVNVRLKVETLKNAMVIPTAAVQRGPAGTFSYVIGADNVVSARPVTVVQQTESDAVIGSGLAAGDRVVTTGFANLADGARVSIGSGDQTITPDLAPRRRGPPGGGTPPEGARDGAGKGGERGGRPPGAGAGGGPPPGRAP
jgi:multidrug efflux system membrane fusion protein